MNHCAELLQATVPVKEEVKFSIGTVTSVSHYNHPKLLQNLGLESDTIVKVVNSAQLGGFEYRKGLLLTLPYHQVDHLPVFASILEVMQYGKEIIVVVQDCHTLYYDDNFGAFAVVKTLENPTINAYYASALSALRPASPWFRYDIDSVFYVSPRSTLVDTFLSAREEEEIW